VFQVAPLKVDALDCILLDNVFCVGFVGYFFVPCDFGLVGILKILFLDAAIMGCCVVVGYILDLNLNIGCVKYDSGNESGLKYKLFLCYIIM
jgi:hypothetical protein